MESRTGRRSRGKAHSEVVGGVAVEHGGVACSGDGRDGRGEAEATENGGGSVGVGADADDTEAPTAAATRENVDRERATQEPCPVEWVIDVADSPSCCLKIKKGQSVNWNGDFGSHPIAPIGGDSPNPIDATSAFDNDAGSQTVTAAFANVGTFGYHCEIHAAMLCAIQVVP